MSEQEPTDNEIQTEIEGEGERRAAADELAAFRQRRAAGLADDPSNPFAGRWPWAISEQPAEPVDYFAAMQAYVRTNPDVLLDAVNGLPPDTRRVRARYWLAFKLQHLADWITP